MGFVPYVWGPPLWTTWHILHLNYPLSPTPEMREAMHKWIESLVYLIPCPSCRMHYTLMIRQYPPQLDSKSDLCLWGLMIHNMVNSRLGKREWDEKEFFGHYATMLHDVANIKRAMAEQEQVKNEAFRITKMESEISEHKVERQALLDSLLELRTSHHAKGTEWEADLARVQTQARHEQCSIKRDFTIAIVVVVIVLIMVAVLVYVIWMSRRRRRLQSAKDEQHPNPKRVIGPTITITSI